MTNKDCPCRFCKPPERHIDCHGACERYKTWNAAHVKSLSAIRGEKEKTKSNVKE